MAAGLEGHVSRCTRCCSWWCAARSRAPGDCDDIVDWGNAHLAFLRGFAEFHFGIPCADWLRCVMNRIDPKLFMECFSSWVAACWASTR
jgi:hypothetical protein